MSGAGSQPNGGTANGVHPISYRNVAAGLTSTQSTDHSDQVGQPLWEIKSVLESLLLLEALNLRTLKAPHIMQTPRHSFQAPCGSALPNSGGRYWHKFQEHALTMQCCCCCCDRPTKMTAIMAQEVPQRCTSPILCSALSLRFLKRLPYALQGSLSGSLGKAAKEPNPVAIGKGRNTSLSSGSVPVTPRSADVGNAPVVGSVDDNLSPTAFPGKAQTHPPDPFSPTVPLKVSTSD